MIRFATKNIIVVSVAIVVILLICAGIINDYGNYQLAGLIATIAFLLLIIPLVARIHEGFNVTDTL